MGETGANHVCDGELLVLVTVAGGAWGVLSPWPQLDLPGSSTSSPRLVVGTKPALFAGLSSCPSGARKVPRAGDMGMCPAGPAGFSSPTAAEDATTAKRCHFLQLGFYRVGGRGAFTELCLHFWSFLRDISSHEPPACHEPPSPRWPVGLRPSFQTLFLCCLCSGRLKSIGSEGSVCRGLNIPVVRPTSLWLAAPQCPAKTWILSPPAWPHTEDQPHSATARGAQACVQHFMGRRAAPSPLGRSAGGLKVPGSPLQPFSLVKGKVLPT